MFFCRYDSEANISSDEDNQGSGEDNTRKRKPTTKLANPPKKQKQVTILGCLIIFLYSYCSLILCAMEPLT